LITRFVERLERDKSTTAPDAARGTKEFVHHFRESHGRSENRPAAEANIYHGALASVIRWQHMQQAKRVQFEREATPLIHWLAKKLIQLLVSDLPFPTDEDAGKKIAGRRHSSSHGGVDRLRQPLEERDEFRRRKLTAPPEKSHYTESVNPFPDKVTILDG